MKLVQLLCLASIDTRSRSLLGLWNLYSFKKSFFEDGEGPLMVANFEEFLASRLSPGTRVVALNDLIVSLTSGNYSDFFFIDFIPCFFTTKVAFYPVEGWNTAIADFNPDPAFALFRWGVVSVHIILADLFSAAGMVCSGWNAPIIVLRCFSMSSMVWRLWEVWPYP